MPCGHRSYDINTMATDIWICIQEPVYTLLDAEVEMEPTKAPLLVEYPPPALVHPLVDVPPTKSNAL